MVLSSKSFCLVATIASVIGTTFTYDRFIVLPLDNRITRLESYIKTIEVDTVNLKHPNSSVRKHSGCVFAQT